MRWLRFFGRFWVLGVSLGFVLPNIALAQSAASGSGSVTLSATVLEQRGIIVDKDQSITEIYSNTDNSVMPVVSSVSYGGTKLPLSPGLQRAYDQLMAQVKGNHDLIISRAKASVPTNFVDPDATGLYIAKPAATSDDPEHIPYFISFKKMDY